MLEARLVSARKGKRPTVGGDVVGLPALEGERLVADGLQEEVAPGHQALHLVLLLQDHAHDMMVAAGVRKRLPGGWHSKRLANANVLGYASVLCCVSAGGSDEP